MPAVDRRNGLADRTIVFVVAGEVLGGAERSAFEVAADLEQSHGAQVRFCALDDRPGPARTAAAERGLEWETIRTPWTGTVAAKGWAVMRFAERLRRLRPDVVVASTNLPNVLGGLTWRRTGAASFVWNQCDVLGSKRLAPRLVQRALSGAPVIVTTAYHTREWIVDTWQADPQRVHVIRSKVELPPALESRAAWRRKLEIPSTAVVACMVAHLHAGKDHATLLRAWRIVLDSVADRPPPVLLLVGRDAGRRKALEELAAELGLGEGVRFAGETADISGVLGASDLAVFSSRSEGLGRGATEPMYAGLPVIGTDVPGIREAVGEPGRPFLVPAGDAVALAEVTTRLVTDADLRHRVGRACAALIRARQSSEMTTAVYAELLGESLRGSTPSLRSMP